MKKETKQIRADIVNKTLFYIYRFIDTNITLDELAKNCSTSKYHFHRVFKEETGKNIFETITSIRLQKASNLLISNTYSTISEIAKECGYSSHSSFIKAFKQKFETTPTKWRKGGYLEYSKKILKTLPKSQEFKDLDPSIKVCPALHCAYIRHKGYDKSIKNTWQKLHALAYEHNLKDFRQIALHHDNPTITPLKDCSYVAAIEVPKDFNSKISTFEIPESLYAVFNIKGVYGDVLNFIQYVYNNWLNSSGYEAKTLPSYVIYNENHFINSNEKFDLDFYLPVSVAF